MHRGGEQVLRGVRQPGADCLRRQTNPRTLDRGMVAFRCLAVVAVTLAPLSALAAEECLERRAIEATAAHPEISAFCARSKHGCDFKARPPSPLNADEKADASLRWVVIASQIHSFDEQGKPRFMPEGAMFTRVIAGCVVRDVIGHAPRRK
jgi:hypothetical protein